jgi:hypothetical protein
VPHVIFFCDLQGGGVLSDNLVLCFNGSSHAVADPVLHVRAEVQRGEAHQAARKDQHGVNPNADHFLFSLNIEKQAAETSVRRQFEIMEIFKSGNFIRIG